ncbi:MAG: hypothetical protein U0797_30020 [Gemmataceae bacterium]
MDKPRPAVTLNRHPPERREARPVSLCAGCCCCCCCCCLHTLGGILGSAVAPASAPPPDDRLRPVAFDDQPFPPRSRGQATSSGEDGITSGQDRPRRRRPADDDEDVFDLRSRRASRRWRLFWYVTLVLSVLLVTGFGVASGRDGGGSSWASSPW